MSFAMSELPVFPKEGNGQRWGYESSLKSSPTQIVRARVGLWH